MVVTLIAALFATALFTASPAAAAATKTVKCESWGGQYKTCETGATITGLSVKTQHSSTACRNGTTYGKTGSKIWVNKGCRATFNVTHAGSAPAPDPVGPSKRIKCESWGGQYKTCNAGAKVVSVSVQTQHSGTACRYGSTFGKTGSSIWVNKGCRATFNVTTSGTANLGNEEIPYWVLISEGPVKCHTYSFGTYCRQEKAYEKHGSRYCDGLRAELGSLPSFPTSPGDLRDWLESKFTQGAAYAQYCMKFENLDCYTSRANRYCTPR